MQILILSTNIINGYSKLNALSEKKNQYFTLICNDKKNKKNIFLLHQLYFFLFRLPWSDKFYFLKLLNAGKIKITPNHIHSSQAISWISKKKFDLGIHGINLIYKEKLLNNFKIGILNAHLGLLPRFRGKSVAAWSLFENRPTGISTFIIDSGIDTGEQIVFSEEVKVDHCKSASEAKNFLASKSNIMYKKAIEKLGKEDFCYIENDTSQGKRYYTMSKLFTSFVDRILQN